MQANNKGAGLYHPTIPNGPLAPFNERTRLRLLVGEAKRAQYWRIARIERILAKAAR